MQQEKTSYRKVLKFKNFFETNWCPSLERSQVDRREENKVVQMWDRLRETFTSHHWTVSQGDQWSQWILDWTLWELIEKLYEWMKMTCIVLKVYKKSVFWKCGMDIDCNDRPIYPISTFDNIPEWYLLSVFALKNPHSYSAGLWNSASCAAWGYQSVFLFCSKKFQSTF